MHGIKREELKAIIEGRGCGKNVPMLYDQWIAPSVMGDQEEGVRRLLSEVPCDAAAVEFVWPDMDRAPQDDPDYRWMHRDVERKKGVGLDSEGCLEWEEADAFYAHFPSADYPGLIPGERPKDDGRYLLGRFWYCFFERLWSLRGMENALTDFYLYPEEVHRLFRKLTDFYMRAMERGVEELGIDGIFTSDDIGTQKAPFFSLEIFREFFKPYYRELCDKAHELGIHFWLHSCGNIELFLKDFIEIGLDVIHPIQKGTMDEKRIAQKYGDRICLYVGFDVQQTIPFGTEEEVRREVRHLIDTYARPDGRFLLTMGNNTTQDWKLSSLEALYDETISYGQKVFRRWQEGKD